VNCLQNISINTQLTSITHSETKELLSIGKFSETCQSPYISFKSTYFTTTYDLALMRSWIIRKYRVKLLYCMYQPGFMYFRGPFGLKNGFKMWFTKGLIWKLTLMNNFTPDFRIIRLRWTVHIFVWCDLFSTTNLGPKRALKHNSQNSLTVTKMFVSAKNKSFSESWCIFFYKNA